MDFDPDGIGILKCYRYGSQKLSHETEACVQAMRWLGIKSEQLVLKPAARSQGRRHDASYSEVSQNLKSATEASKMSVSSVSCEEPVTYLSSRDRKTASALLRTTCDMDENSDTAEIRRELQILLVLGVKAEIEWLDECGNLCSWLDKQIDHTLSY